MVICGGGDAGFIVQGLITKLHDKKVWDIENIESIYATSIGTIIALGLSLKIDIETINKYLLERPYDFLNLEPHMLFGLIENKGVFDKNVFLKYFSPLLKSVDLSIDITMKELYEYSKIELNIITSELNKFESIQLSHITHPDLKVLDAVAMSCALPTIFKPIILNDKYYFDGGLFNNYPLINCMQDKKCDIDEIIAFKKISSESNNTNVDNEINNIFDYMNVLLRKMIQKCSYDKSIYDISGNNVNKIVSPQVSLTTIIALKEKERRYELFNIGFKMLDDDISLCEQTDISTNNDLINNNLINSDLINSDLINSDSTNNNLINSDSTNNNLINNNLINSDYYTKNDTIYYDSQETTINFTDFSHNLVI